MWLCKLLRAQPVLHSTFAKGLLQLLRLTAHYGQSCKPPRTSPSAYAPNRSCWAAFCWPFGSDQDSLQNHFRSTSLRCRDSSDLKAYEINPNHLIIFQEQTEEKIPFIWLEKDQSSKIISIVEKKKRLHSPTGSCLPQANDYITSTRMKTLSLSSPGLSSTQAENLTSSKHTSHQQNKGYTVFRLPSRERNIGASWYFIKPFSFILQHLIEKVSLERGKSTVLKWQRMKLLPPGRAVTRPSSFSQHKLLYCTYELTIRLQCPKQERRSIQINRRTTFGSLLCAEIQVCLSCLRKQSHAKLKFKIQCKLQFLLSNTTDGRTSSVPSTAQFSRIIKMLYKDWRLQFP